MKVRPLYDRILVKRIEAEQKTAAGIIIPDTAKEKPQQGLVVAVGEGKRTESGRIEALDVKVGERVMFGKYAGNEIKIDEVEHIILREDELIGIVSE
ncbi:MAG: co-chaperone GroES [Myxococcota bacterium]|nr:co-chaperone GroES [Myxococcota bacterium]